MAICPSEATPIAHSLSEVNRNTIPFHPNGPWYTSGLRLGTPATTTLGMGPAEMREIASIMLLILRNTAPEMAGAEKSKAKFHIETAAKQEAHDRVERLLSRYPVYPEIDLEFLKDFFASADQVVAAR